MDDEVYRVAEYPNQEKGFIFDEEKFGKFSQKLFKVPIFGYICGIITNLLYFYYWKNKKSILSILLNLFINYLIIEIILKNVLNVKEPK